MLCGSAGIGKTTVAKALCNELGADFIVINGSDEGRLIDTLRTKIKNFFQLFHYPIHQRLLYWTRQIIFLQIQFNQL